MELLRPIRSRGFGSVTSLRTSADRQVGTSGVSRKSQLDAWHIVPQRDAIEATGVGEPDGLPSEREDRAGAAQTLELVLAAGFQMKARAVQEVARRAGDQDLAGTGERGYARRRVHSDAACLATHDLDLARVKTDPDANP